MIASGDFRVEGERVLELGAGAGLPGIVAALAGAGEVSLTWGWVEEWYWSGADGGCRSLYQTTRHRRFWRISGGT